MDLQPLPPPPATSSQTDRFNWISAAFAVVVHNQMAIVAGTNVDRVATALDKISQDTERIAWGPTTRTRPEVTA
jgi:hypothetical protein